MVGVVLWARITVFVGSPLILYVQSNMCRGVPRAERENGGRVKWNPLCIVMVMKSHMVLLGRSLQKWIFASPAWLYRPSLLPYFNGFANRMCTFALPAWCMPPLATGRTGEELQADNHPLLWIKWDCELSIYHHWKIASGNVCHLFIPFKSVFLFLLSLAN